MYKAMLFAAAGTLVLAGCGPAPSQGSGSDETSGTASDSAVPSPVANPTTAPPGAPAAAPMPSPPPLPPAPPSLPPPPPPPIPLTPEAQKGEKGARAILLTWARALENHQFGVAWEQFLTPPSSRTAYARWWQRYRTITVAVGDGSVEGGAGSLYYEVTATLTGTDTAGRPFKLQGPVVVRRVNDVDGASPAQLRWHLASADLKAVPVR